MDEKARYSPRDRVYSDIQKRTAGTHSGGNRTYGIPLENFVGSQRLSAAT